MCIPTFGSALRKVGGELIDAVESTDRVLRGVGRFRQIQRSMSLTFNEFDRTYLLRSSNQQVAKDANVSKILSALSVSPEPMTKSQILNSDETLKESTVRRRLEEMVKREDLIKTGTGQNDDPFRYQVKKSPPMDF